jgi:hypothetical protein
MLGMEIRFVEYSLGSGWVEMATTADSSLSLGMTKLFSDDKAFLVMTKLFSNDKAFHS